MKIMEIIPTLGAGGAERFVVDLSNCLQQHGHEVYVVTLRKLSNSYSLYYNDIDSNIKVISLNKNSGFSIIALIKLLLLLIKIKPDIVHSHLNSFFYILLPSLLGLGRISYFKTIHNDADKDAGTTFFGKLLKFSFKYKKVIPITISDESAKSFVDYYGFNSYATIYNGRYIKDIIVSDEVKRIVNKVKKTPKTKVLLFAARFVDQKRPYLHAKICDMLYKEGHDLALLMFGDDNSDGSYWKKINDLHSECVHLFGVTSMPLEFMKEVDGLLLLSSFEGLPISLIEALGVGCIPICTPVGGVKNIIHTGKNGFLANDCSEISCYNIVKEFLDTPESTIDTLKIEAKNSFEPLSIERCCNDYISVFERVSKN